MFTAVVKDISVVADLVAIIGIFGAAWGLIASYFLWKQRNRRHQFSKVYFPKDSTEFYEYYVDVVSKARSGIYITSDGFNMCNSASRIAAERMNNAQAKAIARGATVLRYQMLDTMHINWLYEIAKMQLCHGTRYRTFINESLEHVGHFAVIDPGTRDAVVEFMLPSPGGISQATVARDFGFIHGHQAKADKTLIFFEELERDEGTTEITEENYVAVAKELFEVRVARHHSREGTYYLFDEEILKAQRRKGRGRVTFEEVHFQGWPEPDISITALATPAAKT